MLIYENITPYHVLTNCWPVRRIARVTILGHEYEPMLRHFKKVPQYGSTAPCRLQIPNVPSPKPCNRKQTSQCRQLNEKFLRTILVFLLQFLKSGLSGYLIQQNLGLFLSTQWDRKITKRVVKCMLTMEWETYKNSTIVQAIDPHIQNILRRSLSRIETYRTIQILRLINLH